MPGTQSTFPRYFTQNEVFCPTKAYRALHPKRAFVNLFRMTK